MFFMRCFCSALLCFMLLTGGCSAPVKQSPLQGTIKEGIYYSADRAFSVAVPVFVGLEAHDGKDSDGLEWVDFQVGCCNWVAAGGYSLEWRRAEKPARNFGEFLEQADRLIKANIKQAIDQDTQYVTLKQRTRAINGKQARQVVGLVKKDSVDAFYAATVVNQGSHYALGIVIFLVHPENRDNYSGSREWTRYVQFMESIRKNTTLAVK